MPEPMSAAELIERYAEPDFRDALTILLDLRNLLEKCKVPQTYQLTRGMYDSLHLTPAGERLRQALSKKGVKYSEARFMCYLRMLGEDLLVDPVQTDKDTLIAAVSDQVKEREMQFPYTYGRLLYDKLYSMSYRESHTVLTSAETMEVLSNTPQGVFQVGNLLTGPFGLLTSPERRSLLPASEVPFHCSDIKCEVEHRRILTTSEAAAINKALEVADKLLDRRRLETSDWGGYFRHFNLSSSDPYDDLAGDSLAYLLGDALTLSELKALLARLLDTTDNELRQIAVQVGVIPGPASQMVDGLDVAELIQLALMAPNKAIGAALDTLVSEGTIRISPGEVRVPVLNKSGRGVGWYSLRPELGRYGLRFISPVTSVAVLRLRRLVSQMYRLEDEGDRSELEWQLRTQDAASLEAKLEQYLQKSGPREAVSSLLLARKSNVIVASSKLALAEDTLINDTDRINAVMWKLGFSVEDLLDPHRDFWALHEKMLQVTRQSPINPVAVDAESVRRYALDYFVKLERLLRDAVLFSTWALTSDHLASNRPFGYRPWIDEAHSLARLSDAVNAQNSSEQTISFTEDLTLYPLMRAFQVLSDYLRSAEAEHESHLRPKEQLPDWVDRQDLQEFVFKHNIPFLDLMSESRSTITKQLRDIGRRLVAAEVNEARNEWFHAKRRPMDMERLREGLEAIRDAVSWIEQGGFCRQVYREVRRETDDAKRTTVVLADARGQEVVFHRPSRFTWLGFPSLASSQHVVVSARFAEPSEVLRFRSEVESPYSEMWRDYPMRMSTASSDLAGRTTRLRNV